MKKSGIFGELAAGNPDCFEKKLGFDYGFRTLPNWYIIDRFADLHSDNIYLQAECAGFDLVVSSGACWIHEADTITDVGPRQGVNQYIRTVCEPGSPTPSPGTPTRE